MDIIFVNAIYFLYDNSNSINIGQLILRDILKNDYEVECVSFDYMNQINEVNYTEDLDNSVKIMANKLLEMKPKIIGFYTICNSFIITVLLAKYIRKVQPNIKIIFGGPHATINNEEILKQYNFVDVICLGESEYSIKPLVEALLSNTDLSQVPGISYLSNGQIVSTEHAELVTNEKLSNYTVYDFNPFILDNTESFMIEGGRGCPFSCTFCTTSKFWDRKYRVKPVRDLIDEMNKLNKLYGIKKFSIQHDMFTANRVYISEFCQYLIDNDTGYSWGCSSRVDVLDFDLIDLMSRSNCTSIYIGIETGSSRMQKEINKNLNLDHAVEIIEYISKKEIEVTTSFIYCFPNETIEDFKNTIHLMEKLLLIGIYNVQLHRFMPLPNTDETDKIRDVMYYDPNVIETTMNIVKPTKEIINMIKRNKLLFSQYYTFNSVVKDAYTRFDVFIEKLGPLNIAYRKCINTIVGKYGLEDIYFFTKNKLDEIYHHTQYLNPHDRASHDVEKYNVQLFHKIFIEYLKSKKEYNNKMFNEIVKYEYIKYIYSMNIDKKPTIIQFSVNIEKAINNNICESCDYYVRYISKNKFVHTTRVIPKKSP
nr:radical SAM protein [uncultured Anaerosporobacter sp.]